MPFSPGFNLTEALDLVALSAIIEGGGGASSAHRLEYDL